jgi:hypothetical protein
MVWDRHEKGPAVYSGQPAAGLSEDHALEIKDQLTKRYIARG